ncbi:MAG: hypothetical protein ABSH28_14615, partial [Acidobacteriota bacterium]
MWPTVSLLGTEDGACLDWTERRTTEVQSAIVVSNGRLLPLVLHWVSVKGLVSTVISLAPYRLTEGIRLP